MRASAIRSMSSQALLKRASKPPAGGIMKAQDGSFFVRTDANVYAPTNLTIGPWDAAYQHGGPPAALIAHNFIKTAEQEGNSPFQLTRFSFHLYRPLPVTSSLLLELKTLQRSKTVHHLEATLAAVDEPTKVLARADALLLRDTPSSTNDPVIQRAIQLSKEAKSSSVVTYKDSLIPFAFDPWLTDMHTYTDTLDLTGESLGVPLDDEVSLRKRSHGILAYGRSRTKSLILDRTSTEPTSVPVDPLLFVLIWGDAGSGMSAFLPWDKYIFSNVDLHAHFQRRPQLANWDGPVDDWQRIGMQSVTSILTGSHGVATTQFFDPFGHVARLTQNLIVKAKI